MWRHILQALCLLFCLHFSIQSVICDTFYLFFYTLQATAVFCYGHIGTPPRSARAFCQLPIQWRTEVIILFVGRLVG